MENQFSLNNYIEPNYPIVKTEMFDDDNMKYILCDERFNKNDRTRLSNYNKHRRTGSTSLVEYKLAEDVKEHKLGRLYPSESIGLQAYRFDIRNPLTQKWYWDIDMENSHPCIAEKLCKDYNLRYRKIHYYITNRNECLNLISKDRKTAKTEVIKILYGGEIKLYNEFYENCDGEITNEGFELLRELKEEFDLLKDTIWERNCHLHKIKIGNKILNKKSNCKVSLLSIILQTKERELLMMIDYALRTKYNRSFGVLIHDGGLIQKLEGETSFPQEILNDISSIISNYTGIRTILTQKAIEYDWQPIQKASPYEVMKLEFEKKYHYVGNRIIYEMDNGEIDYYNINDLKHKLKNKFWIEEDLVRNSSRRIDFLEAWLQDEDRRSYERVDFIPNKEQCPLNVYNLFKGFKAEELEIQFTNESIKEIDITDEEIYDEIELILNHIKHLTNGDKEGALFVLNVFSNIIQNPHRKCEVAILFRDENGFLKQGGGTGKSLFTNQFFGSKIIGDKYSLEVQDNNDLYSTFNSQYAGKLLLNIEECDGTNHSNNDKLKSKITSKKLNVNRKNVAQFSVNDFATLLFNTNSRNPLPIKQGNRRMCVFDANQTIRKNTEYFTALVDCMETQKTQYYFYLYLKRFKETYKRPIDFQNNIPINAPYVQMCQLNAPTYLKWINYKVMNGLIYDDTMRNIYLDYVSWIKEHRETKDDKNILSETAFGKLIEGDGNIISPTDEHYCLLNVGIKKKSNGVMKYKWNINSLVRGLKDIYLLEKNFEYYSEIENKSEDGNTTESELEETEEEFHYKKK